MQEHNYLYNLPKNFNYDIEGLWSLTLPTDANNISNIILNECGSNIVIFDGTAGLGGNLISFSHYFTYVIGIENNNIRYNLLKKNIKLFNLHNVYLINDDCTQFLNILFKFNDKQQNNFCLSTEIINKIIFKDINCFFFDPPWGGPKYKQKKKIKLNLGIYSLNMLIMLIKKKNKKSIPIFIKLPKNYDFSEFYKFNYKIYKIRNYYLLLIY